MSHSVATISISESYTEQSQEGGKKKEKEEEEGKRRKSFL